MLSKGRRARVLRDINEIRKSFGKTPLREIPKGDHTYRSCPVARGIESINLEDGVVSDTWYHAGSCGSLSPVLRRFVADFDAGEFPELELPQLYM